MSALAYVEQNGWAVDGVYEGRIKDMVKELAQKQETLQKDVLQRVAVERPKVSCSNSPRIASFISCRRFGIEAKEDHKTGGYLDRAKAHGRAGRACVYRGGFDQMTATESSLGEDAPSCNNP